MKHGTYIISAKKYAGKGRFSELKVKGKVEKPGKVAIPIGIKKEEGIKELYIDEVIAVKEENSEEVLRPYNVSSGTSLSAPYVTAAVGTISNIYTDAKSALERKNILFQSLTKMDELSNKVATGSILDLSKLPDVKKPEPSPSPSPEPSPSPSPASSPEPSPSPSPASSPEPSSLPSPSPNLEPSTSPSTSPNLEPSTVPSSDLSPVPSSSNQPTYNPPSISPTTFPSTQTGGNGGTSGGTKTWGTQTGGNSSVKSITQENINGTQLNTAGQGKDLATTKLPDTGLIRNVIIIAIVFAVIAFINYRRFKDVNEKDKK